MSHKTQFQIKYEGEALVHHEMEVKDFAPALLSLGELLEEANAILNNGRTSISVNIKATEQGSVLVHLAAYQHLLDQAKTLFSSDSVSAIVNAKELLGMIGIGGGGGAGVIGIVKWLRNRPIKNVVKIDTGDFQIYANDGEMKVCKDQEIKLFRMISIRKRVEAIVRTPLLKPGIDSVVFSDEDGKEQKITKAEADNFTSPEVAEELIDEREIETNLSLVNISFQNDGKWRFNDGSQTFFADIIDQDFNEKVRKNEIAFSKDDIIKVTLVRKQYISDGIKTTYVIKKILDYRSAAIQLKLPFSGES